LGPARLEAGLLGILDEEFHIDVLKLHALGSLFCLGVRRRRNSIVATVRGVNKKLSLIDQITGRVLKAIGENGRFNSMSVLA